MLFCVLNKSSSFELCYPYEKFKRFLFGWQRKFVGSIQNCNISETDTVSMAFMFHSLIESTSSCCLLFQKNGLLNRIAIEICFSDRLHKFDRSPFIDKLLEAPVQINFWETTNSSILDDITEYALSFFGRETYETNINVFFVETSLSEILDSLLEKNDLLRQ